MRVKFQVINGHRICSKCLINKPLNLFYPKKGRKAKTINSSFSSRCMECEKEIAKYNIAHKRNTIPDYQRRSDLKFNFGISLEEYNKKLLEQQNKCRICKIDQTAIKKNFAVDHNHVTNQIRGLLCSKCNMAIGLLNCDIDLQNLYNAIEYLKSFK